MWFVGKHERPSNAFFLTSFSFIFHSGSLKEIFSPDGSTTDFSLSKKDVLQKMFFGLNSIHSLNISHCNVNLDSIVVTASEDGGGYSVKFTDFRCSKETKVRAKIFKTGPVTIKGNPSVKPDVCLSNDVEQAGHVAFEILADGAKLFPGDNEALRAHKRIKRSIIFSFQIRTNYL